MQISDINATVETALQHHQNGCLAQAKEQYELVLQAAPDNPAALYSLGLIALETREYEQAVVLISKAIEQNPQIPQFYSALGVVFKAQGKLQKAIEACQQALSIKSDYPQGYYNLANVLRDQECYQEAIENYKHAIRVKPDYVKAYNNLAGVLERQANFAEAMIYCERAIEIKPDDAEVYYNMGTLLGNQGRCNEAINYYKQAIQLKSDHAQAHLNLSLVLLLLQRFTEGWKEYSWRRKTELNRSYYQHCPEKAIWDGCSFAGKRLLVACEQGLGDSIQFARYLPAIKARGGEVIFETWKPLLALFQQLGDVDELAEASSHDRSDRSFDYYVPLLDLPMIFNTALDTIPANVPYLYADPVKVQCWKDKIDTEKFNVGIVWAGSSEHGNDHNRSCSLEHFAPLAEIEGVRLYSLQKGSAAGQLANLPEVTGLADKFEDFTDTAAAIDNLDLVISVDTAVAHLAGAMGAPVWMLIPFAPDWRWMLDRDDSPWYPTMKLFRQEKCGDWEGVFARVAEQLEILV